MKKSNLILLVVACAITMAFSSCKNMVPYSDTIKTEHGWGAEQLKHVQFYLSHDITLERKLVANEGEKIHGKVVVKNGVKTDIIYLKKGLRCGYEGETSDGNYIIKCEDGDGNTLNFGVNPTTNKFHLLATVWDEQTGKGSIHYNGLEYFADLESGEAYLLIDLRKSTHTDNKHHNAKGKKVK